MSQKDEDKFSFHLPPDVPRSRRRRVHVRLEESEPNASYRPADQHRYDCDDRQDEEEGDSTNDWPESPLRGAAQRLSERSQMSLLHALFELLIPPAHASQEALRLHRLLLTSLVGALVFTTAGAFGLLPKFPGFAYASTVTDIKVELLDARIFDNRVRQCTAATPEGRQFYAEKLNELLGKYQATAGANHALLPSCAEIQ